MKELINQVTIHYGIINLFTNRGEEITRGYLKYRTSINLVFSRYLLLG